MLGEFGKFVVKNLTIYKARRYIFIYISVPFYWHHDINFNTGFRKNRESYKTETFLTDPNTLMAFKSVWKNRKLAKE